MTHDQQTRNPFAFLAAYVNAVAPRAARRRQARKTMRTAEIAYTYTGRHRQPDTTTPAPTEPGEA